MNTRAILNGSRKEAAAAIQRLMEQESMNPAKTKARTGVNYYEYKHDILNNKILYINENGKVVEDNYASNIKIPHPFFTELVDQKVNYLLSTPAKFETDDQDLEAELKEYYDAQFATTMQEVVQGASIKGAEYVYQRVTSEDRLAFQVADSLQTVDLVDENGDRQGVCRFYNREAEVENKRVTLTIAEVWTKENVTFYKTNKIGVFEFDTDKNVNPRPHVIARGAKGEILGRSMDDIPFYRLSNNRSETTDLEPIKALIDDYDLMAAFLSNNLQDFAEAIYVVKNYQGQNMTELRQNLKGRKMVGVGDKGDLDVRTVQIPTEARELKLNINKEAIYKFGMGFDSTAALGGNINNVVIKSRYTLLELKANKTESRLRGLLEWINVKVIEDINRRKGTAYTPDQVKITIERDIMINDAENADIKLKEAQAKQVELQTLLVAANRIDDETTLRAICELLEVNYEEVAERIESEDVARLELDDPETLEGLIDEQSSAGQVAGSGQ